MVTEKQYTVGTLAEHFQEPPARIAYVISKYRIKPCQRIGIIRLFNDAQAEAIKQGLYGLRVGRYL